MTKPFRPLLARAVEPGEALTWPKLASPKLDGVRCLIVDGVPTSRSLKPLPNRALRDFLPWRELGGLDGELIVGDPTAPDAYNRTTSAVMSHDGDLTGLRFHVFDHFGAPDEPYFVRREIADCFLKASDLFFETKSKAAMLPELEIRHPGELLEYEAQCVAEGYEGVMLRCPMASYKFGRTSSKGAELLKIKRFEDSEAEILEVHPLMRNGNSQEKNELGLAKRSSAQAGLVADELLGALTVRDVKTGIEFSIGSGFDQAAREALWAKRHELRGALVKYKFQPAGVKEAPRFPVYLGFRSEIDL
jgi:DNA ligase 1